MKQYRLYFWIAVAILLWGVLIYGTLVQGQAFELIDESSNAYCSGGVVEGVLLTAGHCVEGVGEAVSVLQGAVEYDAFVEARCLSRDGQCDYAILLLRDSSIALPSYSSTFAPLSVGESASYWGSPYGVGLMYFEGGYAGNVYPHPDSIEAGLNGYMLFDITGGSGSSGSIMLNHKGEAVGIVSAIPKDFINNFGVVQAIAPKVLLVVNLPQVFK